MTDLSNLRANEADLLRRLAQLEDGKRKLNEQLRCVQRLIAETEGDKT